ncbi:MAG: ubiquinone/menaquinone biosynthesis methyltransferase [Acidobacteriota bacterium]|nr:ubiquinone/menaquinone biosynthesis methyltransferase [Acidobacteriota bacterium]
MFGAIASRYDRANTILSGGIHHLWRRRAVRRAGVRAGDKVLDCATGTGDLAIRFAKEGAVVTGTDFTPEMIELARAKAPSVRFEVADVMALPFENNSFDVATIGFGIRNVADPAKGIAEMARVAKKVLVLEFGQPPNALLSAFYRFYTRNFLPGFGGIVTGNRAAYEYLESSSAQFPSGAKFVELMRRSAQFEKIEFEPLTFGVAWLYVGIVQSRE